MRIERINRLLPGVDVGGALDDVSGQEFKDLVFELPDADHLLQVEAVLLFVFPALCLGHFLCSVGVNRGCAAAIRPPRFRKSSSHLTDTSDIGFSGTTIIVRRVPGCNHVRAGKLRFQSSDIVFLSKLVKTGKT